ncbi:MAG: hypothetical protein GX928_01370 [Ruminococcaceae bacterium]|nr:hypothetical protein [Oscillospiraceae bacterium]
MAMQFWDIEIWSLLITLTILFLGMMVANSLRRIIGPLRRSLIPSPVLGGFIVLAFDFFVKTVFKVDMFNNITVEALTYHGLGLGFVAITLRDKDPTDNVKKERSTIMNYGIVVVATYLLQGFLGGAATIALNETIGNVFPASGLLLPMGYGQGPGQAYNWGNIYQNEWGFENGVSFGLTVAAMGFVSASVGGIWYLRNMRKKGLIKESEYDEFEETHIKVANKNEIPMSDSIDKLTVQVSLVFIAYIMAYLMMLGIDKIVETGIMGNFGFNTVRPLVWGFNFLFATFAASILKGILAFLTKKKVIKRVYTNDFFQTRISGLMFDLMVVASISAISLSAFLVPSFVISLSVLVVIGTVSTYIYLDIVCKSVLSEYRHEAFLGLYGMLCGTNSTGIILLREIDSSFKTPVAGYMVYQVMYASLFGVPMILLMGFAPQSYKNTIITVIALVVLFVLMNVLLFRKDIFGKNKKKK